MSVLRYRTTDRTAEYRFSFEQFGGVWKAIILDQPPYGTRVSGSHESHRLTLPDRRPYVCWTPEPSSLDACKDVAQIWADCTQVYLSTGKFGVPGELPPSPPPLTGPTHVSYVTEDGTGVFLFRIDRTSQHPGWQVQILRQPPYAGRPEGETATGRRRHAHVWVLPGSHASESMARIAAGRWADLTQEYVRTGRPFRPGAPQPAEDSVLRNLRSRLR